MLCVATSDPDSPSETYIRQHIQKIAPGRTAVLYAQGQGESLKQIPSLRHASVTRGLEHSLRSLANLILYAYPRVITDPVVERFLLEHKVRSLLAEFGTTGCSLLPLCRKLGIRLVVNFHGHDATVMPKRWLIRHAYRRLNQQANAFVCGSKHFASVLTGLGFDSRKIHVIPCGIELGQFTPGAERDENLILAIGRFVEKKAPQLTIQAFIKVLAQFPSARLEMIGDGPLLASCRALIEKNGLAAKVVLHGARSSEFVKQKLQSASLFVQHSVIAPNGDTESQGLSLLEAMACEVPVVSTRHNGFVETVQDGVTGFLVAERDVDGMAGYMLQLLGDSSLREQFGRAGRQRVAKYYEAEQLALELRQLLQV